MTMCPGGSREETGKGAVEVELWSGVLTLNWMPSGVPEGFQKWVGVKHGGN
jgi:hypothetical protein